MKQLSNQSVNPTFIIILFALQFIKTLVSSLYILISMHVGSGICLFTFVQKSNVIVYL